MANSRHLANTLKICSQRTYLLKLLRDQGLPRPYINMVFTAIVLSKIIYALPAWRGFLTEEQIGQVHAFLKRSFKYSFCDKLYRLVDMADDADWYCFPGCKINSIAYILCSLQSNSAPFSCALRVILMNSQDAHQNCISALFFLDVSLSSFRFRVLY